MARASRFDGPGGRGGPSKPRKPKPKPDLGEPLPPRIPKTLVDLERAIMLLGCCKDAGFKLKVHKELVWLVGRYPSVAEAAVWKSALKGLREEMLELGD